MSRSVARGAPQRRPTVRRTAPKKSLGDRLLAAMPVSEAAVRRAVTWSILGIGGAVVLGTASWLGVPAAIGTALADTTGQIGLRVEQVDITGIKRMNRETVYAVALEEQPKAMLRVDLELIRQRLLAYGWIADAYVSRRLPDRLLIHIVEREPAAIWQNGGALTLIDAKGVPLEPVDPSRMPNLPLVIGPGADRQEAAYQRLLAAAPALKPRIKAAAWVGNRRWDITFDTGETLALPQDNAAAALVKFAELDGARSLLGKGWLRFDMRDPAKLVARKPGADMEQAVPATGAGAATQSARFARIDEV
ncbi:cell division protein FtsQ [Sphingomonas sp. OV641]|uniref:cell division protein FtsQ/DivIB n=1 Tax=unclassified Sphingomonas TaxID=196159 RepID=UPI00082E877F|nr:MULTISPECIES: cell division protein FtsQ/DivIB [unclassified Sphingomonas]SEJ28612.1 cell division protein FtsQ [Sphingomonas sp. OV641]